MYSVLIVEDEQMERCFLQSMVKKELPADTAVYVCESGVRAVSMARKYRPDMIFIDILLPELDGLSATAEIKKFLPNIYVCILTACSDFDYAQKAVNLHVFKYMLKPIRPSEIKAVLSQMTDAVEEKKRSENNHGQTTGEIIADEAEKERKPFIETSVKYICKHFQERLTLDSVSLRVYMNPQYFSRMFKREMGVTFTQYVNNLRVQHACKLLEVTNYPAYRIASECGFTDASYFNRVFYKQMNMTPKKYKRCVCQAHIRTAEQASGLMLG